MRADWQDRLARGQAVVIRQPRRTGGWVLVGCLWFGGLMLWVLTLPSGSFWGPTAVTVVGWATVGLCALGALVGAIMLVCPARVVTLRPDGIDPGRAPDFGWDELVDIRRRAVPANPGHYLELVVARSVPERIRRTGESVAFGWRRALLDRDPPVIGLRPSYADLEPDLEQVLRWGTRRFAVPAARQQPSS